MSENIAQLLPLIKEGITQLQQLCTLLDEEVEAITANDMQQLEVVVSRKKAALGKFSDSKEQWSQIIATRGKTIEEFSASLPSNAQKIIASAWSELEQSNEKLQQANLRNSNIVSTRSRQVGHLLSLLKGHQVKHQLYSDGGDRNNYQAQSRIGKA